MTFSDNFGRRALLKAATGLPLASVAAAIPAAHAAPAPGARAFPRKFLWGTATAGHQTEGNNVNSDFWFMENIKPTTYVERSGDACDSYHRYEEDIALVARLGLNTYRFSVEWARIKPEPGFFSNAELDHYKAMIAACQRHGIVAAVTFLHGAAPRWFAMLGGWLHPESPKWFARFCSVTTRALCAGIGYAFTLNEPNSSRSFRALPGASAYFTKGDDAERASHAAAARALNVEKFVTYIYPDDRMTTNLLAAHAQAFAAIKAERPALPVSVTLHINDFQPANDGAQALVDKIRRSADGDWLDITRTHADFVAAQIYRQMRIPGPGAALPAPPPMPFAKPGDALDNVWRPEAVRNAVEYVHRATGKPVFVTENGIDTTNDARRIWYIDHVLGQLHDAIAAGTPVIGYLHWSLLDNFEWNSGYAPRYGLHAVDPVTFRRTAKPSAAHYGAIARRNAIG